MFALKMLKRFKWVAVALVVATFAVGQAAAVTCASLASLTLPDTTITAAQPIPAGTYVAPNGASYTAMPAFCRVAATLTPTSDSVIKMEVWMPDSGWNGRFEGVGGGGFAGTIVYGSLAPAVKLGYAVASTDTGSTSDGSFAFGHPQKIIDFGYRGIHLMTVIGKQITAAFYGEHPRYSYFSGCSTGGRQAGMEAQRYPDDYDGIVQGDPALYQTHHEVGAHLYITWQMFASTSGGVLEDTASTVYTDQDTLLGNAVNAACDAKDGVVDGVLNDPRECHYNPEGLLCTGAQTPPNCLTAAQVQTVKNIWRGPDWMVHQRGYYPAIERGGEALGWPGWNSPVRGGTPTDTHASLGLPFFLYFIFDNPTWDFQTFNWNSDPAYVDNKVVVPGQTMAQVLNATNPDLRRFRSKGGKLIHYHGFSDPDIPTQISINYFDSVVNFNWGSLERTQDFYRLFLVPGMNHCSGGPGANVFDMLTPLVQWVENGIAPKSILATHYVNNSATQGVAFTRPLCPYPQEAVYTGSGSNTDAANFVCKQSKAIEHDVYELFKLFEHDR